MKHTNEGLPSKTENWRNSTSFINIHFFCIFKGQEGIKSTHNSLSKTLWQSQQSLWQAVTENEQLKEEGDAKKKRKVERSTTKKEYKLPRTRKIRLYPKATD